jgi:hypothetical protein
LYYSDEGVLAPLIIGLRRYLRFAERLRLGLEEWLLAFQAVEFNDDDLPREHGGRGETENEAPVPGRCCGATGPTFRFYFRIDIRAIDMYGALPQMFGLPSILCRAIWSWRFAQRVWAFRLKIVDDDTRRCVDDARKRLVRLRDALDDLDSQGGIATRSPAVSFRGGGGAVAAVLGR